jgi:hypothetical protein
LIFSQLTGVLELVHLDHLGALLVQGQFLSVDVVLGSQEDADNDVLLLVAGDIELVAEALVVEAGDTGLDVDVLVGLVGAGEDRVEVEFEVLEVGDQFVDLNVLDLDASHDELLALVGSKVLLVLQEELVQVLVQREEGRVTGGSLVVLEDTGGGL